MEYYIGLDAHSSTSTAVVLDEKGTVISRQTFKTTEGNFRSFLRQFPGKRHLTFEESNLSQWLYVQLKSQVDRLIVCNPVFLSKKSGAKTDMNDALHLARELRGGHLVEVYHDESHWIELRVLVSGYLALVGEMIRAKTRLKAVFRSEAIDTSSGDFYETARDRASELSHQHAKFVAESLFWHLDSLEKQKKDFKQAFRRNLKTYRPVKNLTSVPGIDLIRANIIAATVCMPHRFKNKHKFWAYCMLVRHLQESGGRIYGNKRVHGRSELKQVFLGAAESALRTDTSLRTYYERLREKGDTHGEAKLGLARKIASICLSLLKNGEVFHDQYETEQLRRENLRKELNRVI